jgi:hypothetical protein
MYMQHLSSIRNENGCRSVGAAVAATALTTTNDNSNKLFHGNMLTLLIKVESEVARVRLHPLIMEMIGGWGITRDDVLSWVWQSFSLWRNAPAEYWIIEIKICRDSDPQGQQSKADYQHQVLIEKIQELDPNAKVWYYPLMVGVSGSIYLRTTMYLQALGIKGGALQQCISDVHIAAVKSLYSIYATKRKLEKPKEPVWHRRTYKKPS